MKKIIRLIGIHGHAGVGKDTVASYLEQSKKDTYIEAFADPLKSACAALFGIPLDSFYDEEEKEIVDPFWGVSPRQMAQFVGTELIRNHLGKLFDNEDNGRLFWVRHLQARLDGDLQESSSGNYTDWDTVIICDVRFQEEYDWIIESNGKVIHLTRPGYEGKVGLDNHSSEQSINLHAKEVTYEVENNGTLDDLYAKIDAIVF